MPFKPRSFQTEFCNSAIVHWRSRLKLLCALGTGAGKTKMTAHLFASYAKNGVVWVLCHESSLVLQWLEALQEVGLGDQVSIIATKFPVPKDEGGRSIAAQANKMIGLNPAKRIVICMVKQVEKTIAEAKFFRMLPDYLVIDEGHLVLNHAGCRVLRVESWKNNPAFKTLVLTASPKAHGALVVHPQDFVERCDWITPISNRELIEQGFWSEPEYVELPEEYCEKAKALFKGLPIAAGGEVSGTSQRAVMMALLPDHVEMIAALPRRSSETMMAYCATVEHAEAMAIALTQATGENWLAVDGAKPGQYKAGALEALRSGVLPEGFDRTPAPHLLEGNSFRGCCLVNMWQAGTDAPRASTCIIACVMMSFPRFYQGAGRIVRLFEGLMARYLDLGLNFVGKHPLMEDVDFTGDFEASDLKFADAHTLMCQNPACLYTHKRIPTPKHPQGLILGQPWGGSPDTIDPCTGQTIKGTKGPNLRFDNATGEFSDGTKADPLEVLCCQECGAEVMGDRNTITKYIAWRNDPERTKPDRMGITIGTSGGEPMNLQKMWGYKLWQGLEEEAAKIEPGEGDGKIKDNSEGWEERRDRVRIHRQSTGARRMRSSTLSTAHQRVASVDHAELKAMAKQSPDQLRSSLRRAMLKAYVESQSPLDVLPLLVSYGSTKNIPGLPELAADRDTELLLEAFEGAYSRAQSQSPSQRGCYSQFESWVKYYLDEAEQLLNIAAPGSIQFAVLDRKLEQLSPMLGILQRDDAQAA